MDRAVASLVGVLFGIGQFFMMRRSLKPLAEGRTAHVGLGMLLRLPIPVILLVGCAWLDADLLPFAGGGLCLSMVAAAGIHYLVVNRRKG